MAGEGLYVQLYSLLDVRGDDLDQFSSVQFSSVLEQLSYLARVTVVDLSAWLVRQSAPALVQLGCAGLNLRAPAGTDTIPYRGGDLGH